MPAKFHTKWFRETIEILQEEKLETYIKVTALLFFNSVLCKSKVIMWHSQEAIRNLDTLFIGLCF